MAAPKPVVPPAASGGSGELLRALGAWDGALITIGAVIGTGIFLTTSDMARALPHPGLILLVWLAGGMLALAGALTYAELGVLFPRAGGIYDFLKEAYGPLWGFLYGWASFLVIMSGGIAALAVGFGEYLGSFFPLFSTSNVLLSAPIGPWRWTLSGGQVAAVAAILFLTVVNQMGVKEGAWVQNGLTLLKIGGIAAFLVAGLTSSAAAPPIGSVSIPPQALTGFGIAMIAALWTYDGWYGLTFSAGEMKNPGRNLPLGLILGTAGVALLYLCVNLVYVRTLSVEEMASSPRIGEAVATALLGPMGGRLLSAVVVISTFGCLSATILYSSRIYQPMAADGVFFRSLAAIHPRYRTPVRSLWAQSTWAVILTTTGTYDQLYTYVVFAAVVFHAATGTAVFVLRRTRPDAPRPYRVWGYPVVPALFILSSILLVGNTLLERPRESLLGLGLVALGVPAYLYWRRRTA
jgi:basic amino acid/polyamine antiporter, APA family